MLSRRHLLATGVTGLTFTAVGAPRFAAAQSGARSGDPVQQVVGAQRRKVGDAIVTAISDGYVPLSADAVPNGSAEELKPLFDTAFQDISNFRAACNAYLVDRGDRRVLIDAGGEVSGFASLGRLDENMEALGIAPDSVDALVVTHLHPDHVGGAITQNGSAAFPNAEMILRQEEYDFWHDDANMSDANKAFFDLARNATAAYKDRQTIFTGDVEVLPGLSAVHLPGHTPGHTGYRLDGGDEQMLIWGDIVHMPPVQFAQPKYYIGFDVNPDQAVETRMKVMDMAAADRMKIAGMHLTFPGFGNVAKGAGAEEYRFTEAPFEYEL